MWRKGRLRGGLYCPPGRGSQPLDPAAVAPGTPLHGTSGRLRRRCGFRGWGWAPDGHSLELPGGCVAPGGHDPEPERAWTSHGVPAHGGTPQAAGPGDLRAGGRPARLAQPWLEGGTGGPVRPRAPRSADSAGHRAMAAGGAGGLQPGDRRRGCGGGPSVPPATPGRRPNAGDLGQWHHRSLLRFHQCANPCLQGDGALGGAGSVLRRSQGSSLQRQLRCLSPPLQHQHPAPLAPGPTHAAAGPQRRNQHASGQHQLGQRRGSQPGSGVGGGGRRSTAPRECLLQRLRQPGRHPGADGAQRQAYHRQPAHLGARGLSGATRPGEPASH